MKKPEEYLNNEIDKLHDSEQPYFDVDVDIYDGDSRCIIKAIEQAQKDAWNEAVKECAKNAEVTNGENSDKSITTEYYGTIYTDEQSILKLLKE